jgi:hypothetical protein
MSRNGKIVLGIVCAMLALCLCGAVATVLVAVPIGRTVARGVVTEGPELAATAGNIVDYTLPDGYREEFAFHLAGTSFVSIRPQGEHSHIYLFQLPGYADVNQDELERQMHQTMRRQSSYGMERVDVRTVGQTKVTIRGEEVAMSIGEGENSSGEPYREMRGVFEGRGGTAMLIIAGRTSEWDQAGIDAFIGSMR